MEIEIFYNFARGGWMWRFISMRTKLAVCTSRLDYRTPTYAKSAARRFLFNLRGPANIKFVVLQKGA